MPGPPDLEPRDAHNRLLIANAHPPGWRNPNPAPRYNLVVLGAGTAGLVTAAGAAGLGARVALVERHLLGGDCLNYGCVPSKTLLRAARAAHDARDAQRFGLRAPGPTSVDFAEVMSRVRQVRARISHHDAAERFRRLGVDVFLGEARFASPDTVQVGEQILPFRKAVVAAGARAARIPIPGLQEAGYLTNETLFSLTALPRRLAVIGAGPIGCEMAQAFQRLGSEVTLYNSLPRVLGREEPEAAAALQEAFRRDGIRLVLPCRITGVEAGAGGERIVRSHCDGVDAALPADAILVGVGRTPNVEGLGLDAAGVRHDHTGIQVDDRLRTTNPRIYAAGDVCMRFKFTHTADAAARIVIQNALFLGRRRLSALTVPWCTYTDPEVAHVGMYAADARQRGWEVDAWMRRFSEVDRAIAEGEEDGFVKVLTRRGSDRIVGATIVARHAGEMISELTLAIQRGIGLGALASVIHPYPTQAEAIRQLGDAYNRTRLTPAVGGLLSRWLRWIR